MKKFWNRPITWGDSISATLIAYAIMFGVWAINVASNNRLFEKFEEAFDYIYDRFK